MRDVAYATGVQLWEAAGFLGMTPETLERGVRPPSPRIHGKCCACALVKRYASLAVARAGKLWMLRSLDTKEVANTRAKTVTALQLLR
jgi:hypothetical protein